MMQIRDVCLENGGSMFCHFELFGNKYSGNHQVVFAPPGITPEPWFMLMILYGRTVQGFVIGFADGIPTRPVVRGAGLGAIFSLLLCIVTLNAHNYFRAVMLFVFGIIYGALADRIASFAMQLKPTEPA